MADDEKLVKREPIQAEIVDDSKLPAKPTKERKKLTLSTSKTYITRLLNKPAEEMVAFITNQIDAKIVYTNELILQTLERIANNEPFAVDTYLKLVEGSFRLAQEKVALRRNFLGESEAQAKNNSGYKAQEMSAEQWEQEFKHKQGQVVAAPQITQKEEKSIVEKANDAGVFITPSNIKTVN